jgi:hypothetical protein
LLHGRIIREKKPSQHYIQNRSNSPVRTDSDSLSHPIPEKLVSSPLKSGRFIFRFTSTMFVMTSDADGLGLPRTKLGTGCAGATTRLGRLKGPDDDGLTTRGDDPTLEHERGSLIPAKGSTGPEPVEEFEVAIVEDSARDGDIISALSNAPNSSSSKFASNSIGSEETTDSFGIGEGISGSW